MVNLTIQSVQAVFARENGQGISFQAEETQHQMEQFAGDSEEPPPIGQSSGPRRPYLRLVE